MDTMGIMHTETNDSYRIPTGISGLDSLLEGGFPKGHIILLSGTPGTGKSIACFQYLFEGLKNGEKGLYLSSDEPVENLLKEAQSFGFDFSKSIEDGQTKFVYLPMDTQDVYKEIETELKRDQYDRVVLDSLTPISERPRWMVSNGHEHMPSTSSMTSTTIPLGSIQAIRAHTRHLFSLFKFQKPTVIVTSEVTEESKNLSRDTVSEFLADGILFFSLDTTMDRRKVTIRKMRRTKHSLKPHDFSITEQGITIHQ